MALQTRTKKKEKRKRRKKKSQVFLHSEEYRGALKKRAAMPLPQTQCERVPNHRIQQTWLSGWRRQQTGRDGFALLDDHGLGCILFVVVGKAQQRVRPLLGGASGRGGRACGEPAAAAPARTPRRRHHHRWPLGILLLLLVPLPLPRPELALPLHPNPFCWLRVNQVKRDETER
jgi:hypothetical protein